MSLAAVRIGALDLGIGNVLGSNLFNLLILGLDDIFYRQGPLMAGAGASHSISIVAIVMMNALFLIGLTHKVMTKRFVVAWDTGAIAAVYVVAVALSYCFRAERSLADQSLRDWGIASGTTPYADALTPGPSKTCGSSCATRLRSTHRIWHFRMSGADPGRS